ncbi:hypothetical protein KQI89_01625 [Clostridium sp. MSJ-4]|uniref:Uncharacterized protein n=1 Tax=Clostridium simiarum TaxID=2841506 RepID=A0ABS6EXT3_9CLOT|nr:hypothetical protein [Clostridium simiarum]MBU5590454.1 hypothetical protein [Clostridium simiarum]
METRKQLDTIAMLAILKDNPTFKALNGKGCIVGVQSEEKYIHIRNTGYDRISLEDNWNIIKPIDYDKANELFKAGRMVECIFSDGTRKQYRKMPLDSNVIIEADLPLAYDCLWYCYWN